MRTLMSFITLIVCSSYSIQPEPVELTQRTIIEVPEIITGAIISDDLTERNLYLHLIKEGVDHIDIVMRQAQQESGTGSSELYRTNNNLFGMKHPRVRETTSVGELHGYAFYEDWKQSVADYRLFQSWYAERRDISDYYSFLRDIGYAESTTYIQDLQKIKL